jgi:hypothetical protein
LPTRRSWEHHIFGTLDEGEARQLHDLLARRAGGEVEAVLIERLDPGEARDAGEHLASPRPPRLALRDQEFFDQVVSARNQPGAERR